jgi:hypothetical protein
MQFVLFIDTLPIAEPMQVIIILLGGKSLFLSFDTPSEERYRSVEIIILLSKESEGVTNINSEPKSSGLFEDGVLPVTVIPISAILTFEISFILQTI